MAGLRLRVKRGCQHSEKFMLETLCFMNLRYLTHKQGGERALSHMAAWGVVVGLLLVSPASYANRDTCVQTGTREISASLPGRVNAIVPGLYESYPSDAIVQVGPQDWIVTRTHAEDPAVSVTTYHRGKSKPVLAEVEAHRNNWSVLAFGGSDANGSPSHVEFRFASVRTADNAGSPTNIKTMVAPEGVVPLIGNRGTPLLVFEMLHQLKQRNVKEGGLKTATFKGVQNPETLIHLAARKKEWRRTHPWGNPSPEEVGEMIMGSKMIGTLSTVLTQSGHRIRSIRRTGSPRRKALGDIINTYRAEYPELVGDWETLMKQYGLNGLDSADYDIDFELVLEPV
jgi:hypothetical protein